MPTDSGFLIATSSGDYILLLNEDCKELYLYRILLKAEYSKLKKKGLTGWNFETNPAKTEFAMVYIHRFEKRPTAAMLQTEVFKAIDSNN